ncbi:MAG: glycosyl hydrolase [Planctomycetota bacterium]|nr:glycosyl hydrolase [Planctomycetota bacterium]
MRIPMTSALARLLTALLLVLLLAPAALRAEDEPAADEPKEPEPAPLAAGDLAGLRFRSLGPALMAGRVGDLAVVPEKPATWYVAACSGGVWKTTNAGTTWKPIFDDQGSYSIGCVSLDPSNSNTVWVGTGENNAQRSVSFGDGVYRSDDGGASWTHTGLKDSEHIGMIKVDPRDSRVVYVAAQGPLWRSGGDRGLYKTTDGGTTWTRVLHISDDTGVNEVHFDPRNPDVLYASSWQRRRHVWTLIDGGPESTIYKSTDAGATWSKSAKGLPGVDKGRIGLGVSPVNPDIVYAIVEAARGKSGFYRSTDRGASWHKRGSYKPSGAQYYNEIVCDPVNADRVYALHTILRVTNDGGKTFQNVPRKNRHVDDHALWIDPRDNTHMVVGCDGGVYETHDDASNWQFKANLPITQFYRVSVDESEPFYFVYGGTQDNNSQGGPSRTTDRAGITNADWFVTVGGDGYETRVDPTDPNTVYSQWQYGGLVRHDRRSGERVDIRPRTAAGAAPLRWNWDSPLVLSAHDPKRLYFAANMLFRTDDRGHSWRAVSGDLTQQIDRNSLKVMGRIQRPDAVAKDDSTSFYGNIVSLDESPLDENLLYVGTDDGLVQITEDGGTTWRTVDTLPGVPANTYVSCLTASPTEADTVYAAFDNHKQGDFKPYLLMSKDRGRTWTSMASDLPDRNVALCILQDHVRSDLLFVGTEFGVYASVDRGARWIRLKGGLPTIAVRDMAIQKRENDLVLGTFGRGFYVLDDYTPLRHMTAATPEIPAEVFPVKPALRYLERSRLGGGNGLGWQGAAHYAAKNPAFGAVFTYRLAEKLRTRAEARREREAEARKAEEDIPYPSLEELRAEDTTPDPEVLLVVRDDTGTVVQRVPASREKGLHRAAWNLRYPAITPVDAKNAGTRAPAPGKNAPLALPGTYTVELVSIVEGQVKRLAAPQPFEVVPLDLATFVTPDKSARLAFQRRAARLERSVLAADRFLGELRAQLVALRGAVYRTPQAELAELGALDQALATLRALETRMRGDATRRKHDRPAARGIRARIHDVTSNQGRVTSAPTATQIEDVQVAEALYTAFHGDLVAFAAGPLRAARERARKAGAPWTPARLPAWPPR